MGCGPTNGLVVATTVLLEPVIAPHRCCRWFFFARLREVDSQLPEEVGAATPIDRDLRRAFPATEIALDVAPGSLNVGEALLVWIHLHADVGKLFHGFGTRTSGDQAE